MSHQITKVDLIPNGELSVCNVSQFDNGRVLPFEILENKEAYTFPENIRVELHCRKADGNIVTLPSESITDNIVTFLSTTQLTACYGKNVCEIALYGPDDYLIGSGNFWLEVERDPLLGGLTSTSDIHNLEEQIEDITTEIVGENYYDKSEVDNALALKANAADVYTKSQVDNALALKANAADVYTKTQVDSALALKANAADVYTKTQVDNALALKANAADVYTKQEVDNIILDIMPVDTASGPIATFNTQLAAPLVNVSCNIVATGGNGTPWIDSNVINKEPYIKRAVAGTATRIGNHLYDKLVGGTVAFNQLNAPANNRTRTAGGVGFTNNNDGSVSVNGTCSGTNNYGISYNVATVSGHKLLVCGCVSTSNYWINSNGGESSPVGSNGVIVTSDGNTKINLHMENGAVIDTKVYPQIINLTQMFGSTIADYIYGLEQATAGAGVAWFKALFPNDYYAYNDGELMSVKATAHVMKNASNTVIGNYALDSNLELRGIPNLVNNKLEYNGDTYESNGTVNRKIYIYTFTGSETWVAEGGNTKYYSQAHLVEDIAKLPLDNNQSVPVITSIGSFNRPYNQLHNYSGEICIAADGRFGISGDLKQASNTLKDVQVVFELATPTTEQASPFTNPQVCDENGTEEYTDNRAVAIPVGHETYQANICPIIGITEANITRCGVNLWDGQTYTVNFGQTVYGGVLDVTRGKLKPCIEYPSYNGETLSGRWLSSEATYVEGTTPPTGSQVVSLDDYGTDIDLTPEVISAIVGTNNVYTDTNGDTTVKFKDTIQNYIDKKVST